MKLILRSTINEIKRILCSSGFWLSVGLALLILLTSNGYEEKDGTAYTILEVPFRFTKEELAGKQLYVQSMFTGMLLYQFPMYGPLLAALSFGVILCEEQKYGIRRYLLFKESRKGYVISKAMSAIITSGLAFLLAAVLFLIFLYINYPLRSVEGGEGFTYWMDYQSKNPDGSTMLVFEWFGEHAYNLLQLAGAFIYGVFCGFIGYICTAFFSNVYLAVCIPFFFGYIYYSITQALLGRFVEGSISSELYMAVYSYVSPPGYMYFWKMKDSLLVNMIVLAAVWLAAAVIHMIRIERTTDCGVNR